MKKNEKNQPLEEFIEKNETYKLFLEVNQMNKDAVFEIDRYISKEWINKNELSPLTRKMNKTMHLYKKLTKEIHELYDEYIRFWNSSIKDTFLSFFHLYNELEEEKKIY